MAQDVGGNVDAGGEVAQAVEDAAFADGFDTAGPGGDVAAGAHDVPGDVEAAQAVAAPPATVALTREQWDATQATLAELNQFRSHASRQFDTLGGKYGEVNRALQGLPKGAALTRERFERIRDEFPELGTLMASSLAGAPAVKAPGAGPEDLERRVQERLAQESLRVKRELRDELQSERIHERLLDAHEDYVDVLRSDAFERWRQALPKARGEQVLSSNDPRFMVRVIADFKQVRDSPSNGRVPSRSPGARARLEAAITPQGGSRGGAPAKTEQDYFREGFSS
ncbi:MAG: hypothetical protein V4505_00655 [Pseudomonadota bacterium]